jgi:hypothetical protein
MRYDHRDFKQLISTVHDQQEVIGTMMKTISDQQKDYSESTKEQQKTISDQQDLINRLSMPAGSQLISGTTTTTSTSTINGTHETTSTTATTTTTNISQLTGPMCTKCRKVNVTDKYKSDQRWKSRCDSCLSKIRTTQNKRKRQKNEE